MKRLLTYVMLLFASITINAQETVGVNTGDIKSPEVNNDNSVTFRLFAPQAKDVQIEAGFLPKTKVITPMGEMEQAGRVAMTKDGNVDDHIYRVVFFF